MLECMLSRSVTYQIAYTSVVLISFYHQANFNRLLDVARETYKENVGDIYALRNRLAEEHNLPFTLVYRDSDAGFIFAVKKTDLEDAGGELPRGFVDVTAQKGRWVFSSVELVRPSWFSAPFRLSETMHAEEAQRKDEGCAR